MHSCRRKSTTPKLGKVSPAKKLKNVRPQQEIVISMTEDQEAAMKTSLENHVVVKKIIRNLNFKELKTSRRVDKTWKNFATDELRRQNNCKVRIDKNYYLPKLVKALKTSTNFPCTNFAFLALNLGSDAAQKFLKSHGRTIKTLELGSCEGDEKVFGNILLKQAPNIEHLTIHYPHPFPEFGEETLQSLQVLKWEKCKTENIMRAAPNLRVTFDMDRTEPRLGQVTVCDKVSTYKKFLFYHSTELLDSEFIGFINAGPQLRHLEFCCYDNDANEDGLNETNPSILPIAYQVLLESSKDSLTSLDLTDFCEHLNFVQQFPVLTNVQVVQIGHYSSTLKRCFPSSVENVFQIFPNLSILDLNNVKCNEDINWQDYFPPTDYQHQTIGSVQTLVLNTGCTEQWMNRLQTLCPSFKKLVIHGLGGGHDQLGYMLLKVFRLWSHLEELDIMLSSDSVNLDPAFTGMPIRTCLQLESAVSERRERGFEKWRLLPSIVGLKGLKRLRIRFELAYGGEGFTGQGMPISRVTGMYVFQLMPDLRVSIEYNQNCRFTSLLDTVFQSIAPYVNFAHKHDPMNDYEED